MLDIGWSELLVIAVVAIIFVGPRDLIPMLRTFGQHAAKLKKMAGEFQSQFNEALREAELDDIQKTVSDVRNMSPLNALKDQFESEMGEVGKLTESIKPDAASGESAKAEESSKAAPVKEEAPEAAKSAPAKPAARKAPARKAAARKAAGEKAARGTRVKKKAAGQDKPGAADGKA